MEISEPQVVHSSGSVLFMRCLWVCQVCSILRRVSIIISCFLIKFSGLTHSYLICYISLSLLSLSKCNSLRHGQVIVFIAALLRSSLEKIRIVSIVQSVFVCFAVVSARSFFSISMWLGIHVSVYSMFVCGVEEVGDIVGYFVVCVGVLRAC